MIYYLRLYNLYTIKHHSYPLILRSLPKITQNFDILPSKNQAQHTVNPLRIVAAYMRHGKNNITICKQFAVTPSLFNL